MSDAQPHRCGPRHNPGFGKIRNECGLLSTQRPERPKSELWHKKYEKCGLSKACHGEWVRTAAVDVPIATYSGESSTSNILCSLFGSTTPFSAAQLMALYPTPDDYVSKVTAATASAQQAGFILAADAPLVVQEAQAAPIPQ